MCVGGEMEGLRRLQMTISNNHEWVCKFAKPATSPNSLDASTTVLSPYIKFGCVSACRMYHEINKAYMTKRGAHTQPPVSLHGQLLWREFFYFYAKRTSNFDRMVGNSMCRQIPWGNDPILLEAWKNGRTGYPFIDAIMTQLRVEGWIHHLARHAVACFLTRGDLWQSWEEGAKVFDLYLLDADWALNNANWQWLSCSNFFYQYFRVYSPVAFGKKTDPHGLYIRKWLPVLSKLPDKYIYEPWSAPASVQQQCGCVIGRDYPLRIVHHEEVSKRNMNLMKKAYGGTDDLEENSTGIATSTSNSEGKDTSSRKRKSQDIISKNRTLDNFIIKK
jgi:cryptochrome